jgi:CheY-like chemotaxis protein
VSKDGKDQGLKGRLEDLALLDILQIIAFSKKTGYLTIEGPLGRGAMVFKEGLIFCAYSWSTLSYLRQIAEGHYSGELATIIRQQVEVTLRELTTLQEGAFFFQLTDAIAPKLGGVDISPFLDYPGVDPQHLLLDMAKDMDAEREDTTILVEPESPPVPPEPNTSQTTPGPIPVPAAITQQDEPPPPAGQPEITVVLVDDEPEVTEIIGKELEARRVQVRTAATPIEGARLVREHVEVGDRVVLVTDLRMPTSTGRSFYGGFELVRRVKKNGCKPPVLLMTERLSERARSRARELGISKVAFKPSISKLDPEDYKADLRALASLLLRDLTDLTTKPSTDGEERAEAEGAEDSLLLDFVTSMTEQLVNPQRSLDISRMVLQVASKYFERGILFLIQQGKASGLGGFGLAASESASVELAKELVIDLREARPLAQVVRSRQGLRVGKDIDGLEGSLFATIGRGRAEESALLPMLNNREVLTILYGDNPASGKPLGKLHGVEIFIAQAGMALENVFLHRKLRHFESNLSV